jgi:hypothetical protein
VHFPMNWLLECEMQVQSSFHLFVNQNKTIHPSILPTPSAGVVLAPDAAETYSAPTPFLVCASVICMERDTVLVG